MTLDDLIYGLATDMKLTNEYEGMTLLYLRDQLRSRTPRTLSVDVEFAIARIRTPIAEPASDVGVMKS